MYVYLYLHYMYIRSCVHISDRHIYTYIVRERCVIVLCPC